MLIVQQPARRPLIWQRNVVLCLFPAYLRVACNVRTQDKFTFPRRIRQEEQAPAETEQQRLARITKGQEAGFLLGQASGSKARRTRGWMPGHSRTCRRIEGICSHPAKHDHRIRPDVPDSARKEGLQGFLIVVSLRATRMRIVVRVILHPDPRAARYLSWRNFRLSWGRQAWKREMPCSRQPRIMPRQMGEHGSIPENRTGVK